MSFDTEEWSSTNHIFDDGNNMDKGAAEHFVGSNGNDNDVMSYNELEDDPEYFEGSVFSPKPKG